MLLRQLRPNAPTTNAAVVDPITGRVARPMAMLMLVNLVATEVAFLVGAKHNILGLTDALERFDYGPLVLVTVAAWLIGLALSLWTWLAMLNMLPHLTNQPERMRSRRLTFWGATVVPFIVSGGSALMLILA